MALNAMLGRNGGFELPNQEEMVALNVETKNVMMMALNVETKNTTLNIKLGSDDGSELRNEK